jgi:hypothetical protein
MTSVLPVRQIALAAAFLAFTLVPSGPVWADRASDHARNQPSGIVVADDGAAATASPLVARARRGRVVVRNRTGGYTTDVYIAPDDGVSDYQYINTIPTGFKLILRGVPRRLNYLLYAEDPTAQVFWGPRAFFMRRKFIWTLLP